MQIVEGIRDRGFTHTTPIQTAVLPLVRGTGDLIACAETGTGKTAAFVLPILARLLESGHDRLRALVLVPTRELAAQVETNARAYARFTDLRVGVVFGGVPIGPQERMLRYEGVDLLVATPGRLLDLNGRQSVSLDEIEDLIRAVDHMIAALPEVTATAKDDTRMIYTTRGNVDVGFSLEKKKNKVTASVGAGHEVAFLKQDALAEVSAILKAGLEYLKAN